MACVSREHLNLSFWTSGSLELYDDKFYKLENTVPFWFKMLWNIHFVFQRLLALSKSFGITLHYFWFKSNFHLYCSLQSACVYAAPMDDHLYTPTYAHGRILCYWCTHMNTNTRQGMNNIKSREDIYIYTVPCFIFMKWVKKFTSFCNQQSNLLVTGNKILNSDGMPINSHMQQLVEYLILPV